MYETTTTSQLAIDILIPKQAKTRKPSVSHIELVRM